MAKIQQIEKNTFYEENINKSKFLAFSFCVQNKDEANEILQKLKAQYADCTHICYAYRLITSEEKCSDDGEPQGTAGLPILDVIKKNDVTNVMIAVVRYFGGVKLGAGGLLRAYSGSASNVLLLSGKKDVAKCKKISFELEIFESKFVKIIENIAGIKKIDVTYGEKIQISIFAEIEQLENIKTQINNILMKNIEFVEDEKTYFVGE